MGAFAPWGSMVRHSTTPAPTVISPLQGVLSCGIMLVFGATEGIVDRLYVVPPLTLH
jgi:hypothetical protein